MSDKPACTHMSGIEKRTEDAPWKCNACGLEFMPVLAAIGMAQEREDEVVAIASSMLWDFHQRAVEHYGQESEQAAALAPNEPWSPEFTPETCPHHEYISGRCVNCGGSQFLGEA